MRTLKILILEHNPFQMMALHQMLNAIGVYDVLAAPSLRVAQRSLARRGAVRELLADEGLSGIRDGRQGPEHDGDHVPAGPPWCALWVPGLERQGRVVVS